MHPPNPRPWLRQAIFGDVLAILANLIVGMWRRWVHDLPNGSSGGLRKGHLVEVTHESLTGTHDGGAAAMTEAIHQARSFKQRFNVKRHRLKHVSYSSWIQRQDLQKILLVFLHKMLSIFKVYNNKPLIEHSKVLERFNHI